MSRPTGKSTIAAKVRALQRDRQELRRLLERALVYLREGHRASHVLLEDIDATIAQKTARRARRTK